MKMKRFKRFAAILLSAAMVVTSFNVPVLAATSEEIVVGLDDSESAEDIITGAEAEESAAGTAVEQPQEGITEEVTGRDDTVYVYSAGELVSALNGEANASGDVTIELKEDEYSEPDAFEITKDLAGKLTVLANRNVTMKGGDITLSLASDVERAELTVAENASLILEGGTYNFGIVNNGYFKSKGASIAYAKGDVFVNNKEAELDGGKVVASFENSTAIVNKGQLTLGGNADVQAKGKNEGSSSEIVYDYNLGYVNLEQGNPYWFEYRGREVIWGKVSSYNGSEEIKYGYVYADSEDAASSSYTEEYAENTVNISDLTDCGSLSYKGEQYYWSSSKMCFYRVKVNTAAGGAALTAIRNEKELTINSGTVQATGDSVSSCAIENTNAGTLSIRGGRINSSAVSIYNKGTAEIGSPLATNENVGIGTSDEGSGLPAVLTVDGGKVTVYNNRTTIGNFDSKAAVSTTPYLGNAERFTGTSAGTFTMHGGTVYGVAYDGENYPTLLGGWIYNPDGACVQYVKDGDKAAEPNADVKTYMYLDKDGNKYDAWEIVNGKERAKTEIIPDKGNISEPEDNWKEVGTLKDFTDAVANGEEKILLTDDITLEAPLALDKSVIINGDFVYGIYAGSNAVTIANGAEVAFESLSIYANVAKDSNGIVNNGTLWLDNTYIGGSGDVTSVILSNAGSVFMGNSTISAGSDVKYVVYNAGSFVMYNGSVSAGGAGVAVYNAGNFVMEGGEVAASRGNPDSWAIVYDNDEHLPKLIRGDVRGSGPAPKNADEETLKLWNLPVVGSAVAKAGTPNTRGYFLNANSEGAGAPQDGKNSIQILDGIATQSVDVNTSEEAKGTDEYLVMEQDEVLTVDDLDRLFDWKVSNAGYIQDYTLYTSDKGIIDIAAVENVPVIKAVGKGYAVVTCKIYKTEITGEPTPDDVIAENYIRIEVVGAGERAKLAAKDYKGTIIGDVTVNGYKTSPTDVKFEYHVSESLTGAESKLDKIIQETYTVAGIRIDDKEFQEYFDVAGLDYNGRYYDTDKKVNQFSIVPRTESGGISGVDSTNTKLLIDEVKKIEDIKVSLVLKNKLDQEIVAEIGSFDIDVKSVAPKIKADAITLNRFFDDNGCYLPETITVDGKIIRNFDWYNIICPEGIVLDPEEGYIRANGKKGGKITADVKIYDYVGTYPVSVPVKVTNKAPKVSLFEKSASVYGTASVETDIENYLVAKYYTGTSGASDLDNATVEVVEENSPYKVVMGGWYRPATAKSNMDYRRFYLQPKNGNVKLDKATTVNLKVTWDNSRKVKGKEYSVTLKYKISPAKSLTVKQAGTSRLNTVSGASTNVYFSVTPKTYSGGKFVVTELNGQKLNIGSVTRRGNGQYSVKVQAKDKLEGKDVKLAVQCFAQENGEWKEQLKKPATLTVKLFSDTEPVISKDTAQINMSKVKYAEGVAARLAAENDEEYAKWFALRDKLKASYKVKAVGNWKVTSVDSPLFIGGYYDEDDYFHDYGVRSKNGDLTSIILYPDYYAYYDGKIQVGNTYPVNVVLTDSDTGAAKELALKVKVADQKKADVAVDKTTIELYKDSPYTLDYFTINGDSSVWFEKGKNEFESVKDLSSTPYMGLTVKKVEIADANSPFELIKYESASGESVHKYAITFAGKKYDASKAKQMKKVTLRITYSNGLSDEYTTSNKTLSVVVK